MPIQSTDSNKMVRRCDVLVIGAGPAGSSISALLAAKGWQVEVLEKDFHPRFHIGESLLPHTLPILKHLGVLEKIEQIGLPKYGAELVSPCHDQAVTVYFADATDKAYSFAYQVRREEFDEILFQNCVSKGAIVHEGCKAIHAELCPGQDSVITAVDCDGNKQFWKPRFLVDATGRDTFLASHFGAKERDSRHNSAAIFSHFEGVQRHSGKDEGNISICWFDHGWFWIIPFKNGTTSVGAVCWPSYLKSRQTNLDQFLWDTIALCPAVARRLTNAKLIMPAVATGNYSYRGGSMVGESHIIIGDAFAFIDPVFSTGVHLALNSAVLGADVVEAFLKGEPDGAKRRAHFAKTMRRSLKAYSWFIYRFTQPALRGLFMSHRDILGMKEAVLSLMAGDAFRKTPIWFPIFLFKALYYVSTVFGMGSNFITYRLRRQAVKVGRRDHSSPTKISAAS